MNLPNHVLQRWTPPSPHNQLKLTPHTNVQISCLDDTILTVSGTRSVVQKYQLLPTTATTAAAPHTNTYQLHSTGYLEAHNISPFHTVCQSTHAIYAGCRSGDIAVYGINSRAWSKCLAHSKSITALAAPLHGSTTPLLTGTHHGSCAAHDPHTMLEVGRALCHTERVTWVHAWEASTTSYFSSSNDGTATLWDARVPPKNRIVSRFDHGSGIVTGKLFGPHTLCTASLPFEKVEDHRTTKGYVRRRSAVLNFWDIRKGQATDTVKMVWDGVDVSSLLLSPSTILAKEGIRQRFTLLSVGTRTRSGGSETVLQGCDERGRRQFTFAPLEDREIIGCSLCGKGIVLASVLTKNATRSDGTSDSTTVPALCFVPAHSEQIQIKEVKCSTVEKRAKTQRLSLVTFNKKLAQLGARGHCNELLQTLQAMQEQKTYPSSVSFEVVLRAMVRHQTLVPVPAVLDCMEEMRVRPLDQTCIALLRLASRNRSKPCAQKLMKRISNMGNPTVREVFVELLLINSTKTSLQLAFDMLIETANRKLGISRALIQTFLKAAHARRSTDLAFRLLTAIQQKSQTKNGLQAEEFETVACMLAAIRETDKALALLSQALDTFGLKDSFQMGCSLVQSFGRAGLLSATTVIYAMLKDYEYYEDGGVPLLPFAASKSTSHLSLSASFSSATPPPALLPTQPHHQEWKLGPRVQFAAAHIDAALSCAQPAIAMRVLKSLKVGKTKSHHPSFTSLSHALVRFVSLLEADVQPDKQTKVIGIMQDLGMEVPYECLVSLLGCLALRKRITESMYLFKTLRHFKQKKKSGQQHDDDDDDDDRTNHAFAVLLSAVGRAGLPRVLNQLLDDVFRPAKGNRVVHVDLQIIESAVEALRCTEQPRRAVEIWVAGGKKLTRLVCHNVLICYGMTIRVKQMTELVHQMQLEGCSPDADTYSALIVGCISAGRLDKAVHWSMEFCKYQERKSHRAVNAIVLWFRELKDHRRKRKQLQPGQGGEEQEGEGKGEGGQNKNGGGDGGGDGDGEGGGEGDGEGAPVQVKSTQMYSAIRRLLAKQQRLRKSSRSHPSLAEALRDLMDRLMRTEQHAIALRCLRRLYFVYGTTDLQSALFVLEAGCRRTERKQTILNRLKQKENNAQQERKNQRLSSFQQWELKQKAPTAYQKWEQQQQQQQQQQQRMDHDTQGEISCRSSYRSSVGLDMEWLLRTIEPHLLPLIRSDLFGKAVEKAAVARTSALSGFVARNLIELFASNGGVLSSSIVEAMLRASECERDARSQGRLHTSHLEHPLEVWQKAAEYGVALSNRARLLLLRALVAVDNVKEAVHFLKSFQRKGCRIRPLGWLLKMVVELDWLEEALYIYHIELSRNSLISKEVVLYLNQKKQPTKARIPLLPTV